VAETWSGNQDAITASVRSFAKLTDTKILSIQPWQLKVITLTEPMTIEEFNRKYPSPAPLATLMLINRCDENTRFIKGSRLKNIEGDKLP
jgi:predicted Zn-dependent protease